MDDIELKSCPLCCAPARVEEVEQRVDRLRVKIVCTNCGLTLDHTQEYSTQEIRHPVTGALLNVGRMALNESAIEIWNNRRDDVRTER